MAENVPNFGEIHKPADLRSPENLKEAKLKRNPYWVTL